MISSIKSNWRPVTSGVLQRQIPGPILFQVFISDLDDRTECNLDNAKSGGMTDRMEVTATVQRDLNRLKKWAFKNLTKFNKCKYNSTECGMTGLKAALQ